MPIKPSVDIQKMADEIKHFLDSKKFDLVDYSYPTMECYPPPNSEQYPETTKFAALWAAFFEEADKAFAHLDLPEEDHETDSEEIPGKVTLEDMLKKYSPTLAEDIGQFDELTDKVAEAVNQDVAFWTQLREIILPLYEKSQYYEQWTQRWKAIDLSYDPTPLEVKTTRMWTDPKTNERIRGEILRSTVYPAGFVVKVL